MKRAFLVGVLAFAATHSGCGSSDSDPPGGSTGGSDGGTAGTGGASGSGGTGAGGVGGSGGTTSQPEILADDLDKVQCVGTDGSNIYWGDWYGVTTDGAIKTCPAGGCGAAGPSVVISGLEQGHGCQQMIVSGKNLYWFDGALQRCSSPLPACDSPIGLGYVGHSGRCAIDAAHAYCTGNDQGSGTLMRVPLSSTGPGNFDYFSSSEWVGAVATNGQQVFWIGEGSINSCSTNGCDRVVLASGLDDPTAVAATAENVYWMSRDGLFSCPTSGCGMAPSKLADGPSTVNPPSMGERIWAEMQASGGTLYWLWRYADSDSGIYRCSETDCAATLTALAKDETTRSMTLDAGFVYWVRYTINDSMMGTPGPSTILRIAR